MGTVNTPDTLPAFLIDAYKYKIAEAQSVLEIITSLLLARGMEVSHLQASSGSFSPPPSRKLQREYRHA